MRALALTILVLGVVVLAFPRGSAAVEGWLLLLPPVDQGKLQGDAMGAVTYTAQAVVEATAGFFLLPEAPLRQWEQLRAFDSAATCEQWRTGLEEEAEHHVQEVRRPDDPEATVSLAELLLFIRYSQGMESRCLPVSAVFPPQP